MYIRKNYLLPLLLMGFCTTIASCATSDTTSNSNSDPNNTSIVTPKSNPEDSPTPSVQKFGNESNSKAISGKTTNITLYTSDDQCQELVPKKTEVSTSEPMEDAIAKIFKEQNTADFSISGYRVNVNNGVATVDLRISPESKRQIASLSSCEQFALFSSVRKTLISNSAWKIKDVQFTEKGQNITL